MSYSNDVVVAFNREAVRMLTRARTSLPNIDSLLLSADQTIEFEGNECYIWNSISWGSYRDFRVFQFDSLLSDIESMDEERGYIDNAEFLFLRLNEDEFEERGSWYKNPFSIRYIRKIQVIDPNADKPCSHDYGTRGGICDQCGAEV
jgi:hypothetical protein